MGHPSDGEAWKLLDMFDAGFASDSRNVRFRLATDGSDTFSTNSAPYSCWPSFVVSYNLPPSLCMKFEFMFLCLIVPSSKAPSSQINVMLKPLIEELKQLWIGVEVYDCYKKQKFNLRAAYLWSVYDFKACGIFAGWSIHGELTCPICCSDTYFFVQRMVARSATLIVIDAGCPKSISSNKSRTHFGRTLLSQRDRQSI
jgi:hypothetical protein